MDRQKVAGAVLAILIVVGTLLAAVLIISNQMNRTKLSLGSAVFNAKIAYDESARIKGLNGTNSLGETDAMLFTFPTDDRWAMTTADMKYAIDILWLDKDSKVVYITKDASSESNPNVFTPTMRARYVVELKAGAVDKYGIKVGNSAVFTINEQDIK